MNTVLEANNLISNECYKRDESHLIYDVTFTLDQFDCLGVIASKKDESKVLLEQLAYLRKLHSGEIIYRDVTAPKTPKLSISQIYYLDSSSALIANMNVLEYLMFLTSKNDLKSVTRQATILDILVEVGLDFIALSKIDILSREEKMILSIFAIMFSSSKFAIINLNAFNFSFSEVTIISKIIDKIKSLMTVVIASTAANLVGMCCNKVLYIHNSEQVFFGTTVKLQKSYDNTMYVIKHQDLDQMELLLQSAFPFLSIERQGKMLLVCSKNNNFITNQEFFQTLSQFKIFPDEIKINTGRIANAIEGLARRYDL